ncbi:MAG: hypothetical protein M3526_02825, partial [Actinomycetota bacterium]|nr:hypothetical protein [Actinomycetota bacterium]
GYGYEVGANDWGFTAHIDGMHSGHQGTFEAFIRLDLGFAPADSGLTDIAPVWFNVTGECDADAEFDVPDTGGRYTESDVWRATDTRRFIAAAGHLHDGGLALELRNTTTKREPLYLPGSVRPRAASRMRLRVPAPFAERTVPIRSSDRAERGEGHPRRVRHQR